MISALRQTATSSAAARAIWLVLFLFCAQVTLATAMPHGAAQAPSAEHGAFCEDVADSSIHHVAILADADSHSSDRSCQFQCDCCLGAGSAVLPALVGTVNSPPRTQAPVQPGLQTVVAPLESPFRPPIPA